MLHVQATYASYHSVYMHVHCSALDVLQSTDKALKAQCDARVVYVEDEKLRDRSIGTQHRVITTLLPVKTQENMSIYRMS